MKTKLPHYCSDLCAREAYDAGAHEGEWVNTESEEYLATLDDDAEESCDWCDDDAEPYEDSVWADSDALASAGWGTDEDYGCFGGDDY